MHAGSNMAEEKGTQLVTEGMCLQLQDGMWVRDGEGGTEVENMSLTSEGVWRRIHPVDGGIQVQTWTPNGDEMYVYRAELHTAAGIEQLDVPCFAMGLVIRIRPCAQCDSDLDASKTNLCGGCLKLRYCNQHCQRLHWRAEHKLRCAKMHLQAKMAE
jgi:hypothetical protein